MMGGTSMRKEKQQGRAPVRENAKHSKRWSTEIELVKKTDVTLWVSWNASPDWSSASHSLLIKQFGDKYRNWTTLCMLDPKLDSKQGRMSFQARNLKPVTRYHFQVNVGGAPFCAQGKFTTGMTPDPLELCRYKTEVPKPASTAAPSVFDKPGRPMRVKAPDKSAFSSVPPPGSRLIQRNTDRGFEQEVPTP